MSADNRGPLAGVALALALLSACTAPQRASTPRTGRTYQVAFVRGDDWTDWSASAREAAERALVPLHDTGDRWVITDDARSADLLVRTFDSSARTHEPMAGYYELGARAIHVDPGALRGEAEVRWVVAHEAMHWLLWRRAGWAGHVCQRSDEARDCTALVRGESVLAPVLPRSAEGALSEPHLTPADHELMRQLGR